MLNTAYEMRISDLSSDVCSSDLKGLGPKEGRQQVHIQGGTPVFARQGIRRFQYLDSRIIDQRCKRAPIQSLAAARKGLLRVSLIGYGPALIARHVVLPWQIGRRRNQTRADDRIGPSGSESGRDSVCTYGYITVCAG